MALELPTTFCFWASWLWTDKWGMKGERSLIRSQFDDMYKLLDIKKTSKNIYFMQHVIRDSYNCLELIYVFKVNYTPTKNILEFLYIGCIYIFIYLLKEVKAEYISYIFFFFCEIIQRLRKRGKNHWSMKINNKITSVWNTH